MTTSNNSTRIRRRLPSLLPHTTSQYRFRRGLQSQALLSEPAIPRGDADPTSVIRIHTLYRGARI